MSAFISSTWQATRARIPGAHAAIPQSHLAEMTAKVLDQASPTTAAEAQHVMQHGGQLSSDAQIELAYLVVKHARACLAGVAGGRRK